MYPPLIIIMYDVGAFGKFNGWNRLNIVRAGWAFVYV